MTNLYIAKDGDPTAIPESKSLTILMGGSDDVFYYSGDMNQAIKNNRIFQTSFSDTDGIGSILPPKSKMNLIEERLTKRKWLC